MGEEKTGMSMNRRSFFQRSGWLLAGAAGAPGFVRASSDVTFRPGDRPRHILHLVADGTSQGTLSCAEHLSQLTRQRGLTWLALFHDPASVPGLMDVRSLDSLVTDSAACASAWGSGSRVANGALNMLPDGRALKSLYELFGSAGWKRGLVTTTEITHATPAGFVATVPKRSQAEEIAQQLLTRRIEVLLGGGARFFLPETRADQRDLPAAFAAAGYALLRQKRDLETAPGDQPWLGLFAPGHLPFTLDYRADAGLQPRVPTLAELTAAALRRLEHEEHFILQIEGGRVDHAAHHNDAAGAFHDLIAFDEALDVCLAFRRKHSDTLLVVTTDHGTGNPGLNGTGSGYRCTSQTFARITQIRRSHEWMLRRFCGLPDHDGEDLLEVEPPRPRLVEPTRMAEIIREATGYPVTEKQASVLHRFFAGRGDAFYKLANNGASQLAQLLANHISVGWTSLEHTSDLVPVLAVGPGAERFRGLLQNVDVFRIYTQLAGMDFRNPSVPLLAVSAAANDHPARPGISQPELRAGHAPA